MKYISTLLLGMFCFVLHSQDVVSSTFIKKYPKSYFTQNFGIFAFFDVELYRLKYTTIDALGAPTVASGLVVLPTENQYFYPIATYHHGTVGTRYDVPGYNSFEAILPSIIASMGFIGMAPDYIGLGDSPGIHPYIHAQSEATSSRDLLIAAEKFIDSKGFKTNKNLFTTGYSQGGHASMAFHRMMEANNMGYKLKAAAHLSGPYSISEGMKALLLSDESYTQVAYLANVALSFNLVYGIFPNNDIYQFFKPTYAKMIEKFANEEINLFDMNAIMVDSLKKQYGKAIPKKMLLDNVLNDVVSNDQHIVNVSLRDNDVYNWKPTIPTRLVYCTADEQVAYTNSITALNAMKALGANDVTAIDVKSDASHTDCVSPAMTNTLLFFLQFQVLTALDETALDNDLVPIFPNPTSDRIMIHSTDLYRSANLYHSNGKSIEMHIDNNQLDVSQLPSGLYYIKLTSESGVTKMAKFVKI